MEDPKASNTNGPKPVEVYWLPEIQHHDDPPIEAGYWILMETESESWSFPRAHLISYRYGDPPNCLFLKFTTHEIQIACPKGPTESPSDVLAGILSGDIRTLSSSSGPVAQRDEQLFGGEVKVVEAINEFQCTEEYRPHEDV